MYVDDTKVYRVNNCLNNCKFLPKTIMRLSNGLSHGN